MSSSPANLELRRIKKMLMLVVEEALDVLTDEELEVAEDVLEEIHTRGDRAEIAESEVEVLKGIRAKLDKEGI